MKRSECLPTDRTNQRDKTVDTIRGVAILSILFIHCKPFYALSPNVDLYINQVSRFAVPFFFIISGYYWAKKSLNQKNILRIAFKSVKRIGLIFFIWSLVYLLPANPFELLNNHPTQTIKVIYWNSVRALAHPSKLLAEGTAPHLWFLSTLIVLITTTSIFQVTHKLKYLGAASAIAYILGLLSGPYSHSEIGIGDIGILSSGPLFGAAFYLTGFFLYSTKPNNYWKYAGFLLFIVGTLSHIYESYYCHDKWDESLYQSQLIGTYFAGLGASLISLSTRIELSYINYNTFGKKILGIYLTHLLFVEPMASAVAKLPTSLMTPILHLSSVYFLSLILTNFLLSKQLTSKIVS